MLGQEDTVGRIWKCREDREAGPGREWHKQRLRGKKLSGIIRDW